MHERAIELAGIESGQAVVDVGCGTGNLSFAVLAAQPDTRVTGLGLIVRPVMLGIGVSSALKRIWGESSQPTDCDVEARSATTARRLRRPRAAE